MPSVCATPPSATCWPRRSWSRYNASTSAPRSTPTPASCRSASSETASGGPERRAPCGRACEAVAKPSRLRSGACVPREQGTQQRVSKPANRASRSSARLTGRCERVRGFRGRLLIARGATGAPGHRLPATLSRDRAEQGLQTLLELFADGQRGAQVHPHARVDRVRALGGEAHGEQEVGGYDAVPAATASVAEGLDRLHAATADEILG